MVSCSYSNRNRTGLGERVRRPTDSRFNSCAGSEIDSWPESPLPRAETKESNNAGGASSGPDALRDAGFMIISLRRGFVFFLVEGRQPRGLGGGTPYRSGSPPQERYEPGPRSMAPRC